MLLQKGLACGPLWSDERVYRIAKELQFLQPIKFGNIYLGTDEFHLQKVTITCCGKYMEESSVKNVLAENETYRPNTVNSVMSGSHYVCIKRGMPMIDEAVGHYQQSAFFNQAKLDKYKTLSYTLLKCSHCLKQMKEIKSFCRKRGKDVILRLFTGILN